MVHPSGQTSCLLRRRTPCGGYLLSVAEDSLRDISCRYAERDKVAKVLLIVVQVRPRLQTYTPAKAGGLGLNKKLGAEAAPSDCRQLQNGISPEVRTVFGRLQDEAIYIPFLSKLKTTSQ